MEMNNKLLDVQVNLIRVSADGSVLNGIDTSAVLGKAILGYMILGKET